MDVSRCPYDTRSKLPARYGRVASSSLWYPSVLKKTRHVVTCLTSPQIENRSSWMTWFRDTHYGESTCQFEAPRIRRSKSLPRTLTSYSLISDLSRDPSYPTSINRFDRESVKRNTIRSTNTTSYHKRSILTSLTTFSLQIICNYCPLSTPKTHVLLSTERQTRIR